MVMAKATRDEMKLEALRYMKQLHLSDEMLREFAVHGTVYLSGSPDDVCEVFNESVIEKIQEEYEQDVMVYHVIRSQVFGEEMLTMLTVSQEKDEWDGYFTDLGNGSFLTYAHVQSDMEDGISSVVIAPAEGGGILRIG